ncbi:DUF551 domain-containing protein [Enterobacter asburiae]|uniref:DUF551 domain-containing protein n=1 Tax=Enterobacter asburiae TaxID=61645 RepID=UPI00207508EC|nr:DUF551 domain-containing protein [Enterobacter asburiae]MCM6996516.1 DUF551 domain-containing protein [Enterobacter asburiae]
MSTITKEFTKEQLQQIIETDHVQCGEASALARIALASLEAVPVGEVSEQRDGLVMDGMVDLGGASTHRIIKGASKMKRLPLGTKFYTAPPAPVSVPAAMEMDDDFDSSFEHGKAVGWNACRAAMLQSFGNSEQLNSPVIPDGWVACSERMPDDDDFVYIWPRPDFGVELHVGQYCECHPKGDGWYAQVYEQNYGIEWCPITVTHWMPLPAAPKQELK